MEGNRGGSHPFFGFPDPFGGFGGFGNHGSLFSSLMGGRDPFDDPFFTHPFGGMFESNIFGPAASPFPHMHAPGFLEHQAPRPGNSRGPIIEELNSDDEQEIEEECKEKNDNPRKHRRLRKEPYVEDPDDEGDERKSKQMLCMNDFNRMNNNTHSQPQTRSFTFQSSTVTYGGSNGAYYTSSRTRRTGSDGLTFEESKEADTTTGKATHSISKGLHDKGHAVTRKLNSDGRVDKMEALHNLNEDELASFEEAWKGKAQNHLPGWSEGFIGQGSGINVENGSGNTGGRALPSIEYNNTEHPQQPESRRRGATSSSRRRARSDVGDMTTATTIGSSSSRGRSRRRSKHG